MREKELKKRAERGENDVKGKEKRFEHWQIIAAYLVIYDIFNRIYPCNAQICTDLYGVLSGCILGT